LLAAAGVEAGLGFSAFFAAGGGEDDFDFRAFLAAGRSEVGSGISAGAALPAGAGASADQTLKAAPASITAAVVTAARIGHRWQDLLSIVSVLRFLVGSDIAFLAPIGR
jgi:hypothetical protein